MSATIKWRMAPVPTGRYRSFERRGWPVAWYMPAGKPCAFINCEDEYRPSKVRTGEHAQLTIVVCHHQHPERGNSWVRFKLRKTAKTLEEAKRLVYEFCKEHPHFAPLEEAV